MNNIRISPISPFYFNKDTNQNSEKKQPQQTEQTQNDDYDQTLETGNHIDLYASLKSKLKHE